MQQRSGTAAAVRHVARTWLLILAATLLLGSSSCLVWLRVHGGHVLSVQSGSMAPTFQPGDAVVTQKVPLSSLKAGQVISYRSPANSQTIITHRLTHINPANGQLITQGDHLLQPDPPFSPRLVVGRVVMILPKLGALLDAIRRPLGLALGVYLPAFIIVSSEIVMLVRHYARPQYRLGEAR